MNSNQLCNHRTMISFGMATLLLLALTALPALALNDPDRSADRPVHCYVVPGDQRKYSDDCFASGEFPRLPLVIADSPDLKLTRSKDKE